MERYAKVGQRVRLTGEQPGEAKHDPLPVGATGVVEREANSAGQIWVRWDPPNENRRLMLLTSDPFEIIDEQTGGVRGEGYVGATLDEKPEAYIVAVVEQGRIVEVLARYEVDAANAGPDAVWKRDDVRREDEFAKRERTVLSLAVRHDCDENPVPYVSDGALGHGFECGVCGAFLQAG